MSASLIVAREFLERALSLARSRSDERLIGERICELAQLQELEELRTLAEVKLLGCQHRTLERHRRAETTLDGCVVVAGDCTECGAFVRTTMPREWDGTVYVWSSAARPRRLVI